VEFFDRRRPIGRLRRDADRRVPHLLERRAAGDYPDDEMGRFTMHHVVPRLLGTPGSPARPHHDWVSTMRVWLKELGVKKNWKTQTQATALCW